MNFNTMTSTDSKDVLKQAIKECPTMLNVWGEHDTHEVYLNANKLDIKPSIKVWNHSSEFNWGYGGSGPAQLSLAILLTYIPRQFAVKLHQKFKFKVVASWPGGKDFAVNIDLKEILTKLTDES